MASMRHLKSSSTVAQLIRFSGECRRIARRCGLPLYGVHASPKIFFHSRHSFWGLRPDCEASWLPLYGVHASPQILFFCVSGVIFGSLWVTLGVILVGWGCPGASSRNFRKNTCSTGFPGYPKCGQNIANSVSVAHCTLLQKKVQCATDTLFAMF